MTPGLFLQAAPDAGGGGVTINFPTIDWSQLIPQVVNLFFDAVGNWFNATLHSVFDGLWSGDHNVIGTTPLAMTWGFGPVQGQLADIQSAARVVLLFAVILLGLRGMFSAIIPRQPELLGEFVNGIVGAVVLVAAFPLVIPLVIGLVNQAAAAVAGGAVVSSFLATAGGFSDPLVGGVLFVILLFFALRLLVKAVWRIGFLAVMLPIGLFACAAYAVPQLRWLLGWWARMWGGMLAAQIPSVFALSVGVGLFLNGGSGIGPFVYSIAFLQLATDLYDLLPFGAVRASGPPWGSLPWRAALATAMGPMTGGASTGSAAAAAPAIRPQLLADQYGYR